MMSKLLWLLGPFAVIYFVITVFSMDTDAIFGCGQKVIRVEESPDKTKAMFLISRDCGVTTIPAISVAIIPKKKIDKIDPEGRKIRKSYIFTRYDRMRASAKWVSNDSIEVRYDNSEQNGRKGSFFKQKNELQGVKITYRDVSKTSSLIEFLEGPKKISEVCPPLVEGLQNEVPGFKNSRLLSKIFQVEGFQEPTNYNDYVEQHGSDRDYFCNLDDMDGGVGWRLFIRVNTNRDDFTLDDVSPLFVETRFETSRWDENPNKGKIIWQARSE